MDEPKTINQINIHKLLIRYFILIKSHDWFLKHNQCQMLGIFNKKKSIENIQSIEKQISHFVLKELPNLHVIANYMIVDLVKYFDIFDNCYKYKYKIFTFNDINEANNMSLYLKNEHINKYENQYFIGIIQKLKK